MVLLAISLIVLGVAVGLLGYQLFRVLLPIAGLAAGAIIGYTGVQELFGSSVVSTTVAVVAAVVSALMMALLSYAFFDMAITIFSGVVFGSLLTFLAVALGLSENGFVVTLLAVVGFIIGTLVALSADKLSVQLVTLVTGFLGMGYLLGGIFILSGGVTAQTLQDNGIITTVAQRVDQSFLWVLVWMAGAIVFRYIQMATVRYELFSDQLRYKNQ